MYYSIVRQGQGNKASCTMAHKCHSTYLQEISSYFSSRCLICKLFHPISTHFILFASYIVLFQLLLSYLQAVSCYFNSCCLICRLCHLILTHTILFTTYLLLFSSYIILFQASASSYFHPLHHPIYNSHHPIYNSTDIVTYLQTSLHSSCIYVMLFWSFVLFFTLKTYCAISGNMPLQDRNSHLNSLRHFGNKQKNHFGSCPLKTEVTTTPYYTALTPWGLDINHNPNIQIDVGTQTSGLAAKLIGFSYRTSYYLVIPKH